MTLEKKIRVWISMWLERGYADGIPDEADSNLEALGKVPSYRRICIALMKNDTHLTMLGYSRPECETYRSIKRAELRQRGAIPPDRQGRLL